MKNFGCLALMLFVLSACGVQTPSNLVLSSPQTNPGASSFALNRLDVKTSGGGSIEYSIAPSANQQFLITVTYYNFSSINRTIALTSAVDPNLYTFVLNLFTQRTPLIASPPPPAGTYGGTWTSVTRYKASGLVETISSPTVSFGDLYVFISNHL
jgi:hypothetical protein